MLKPPTPADTKPKRLTHIRHAEKSERSSIAEFYYEFARESEPIRQAIAGWRTKVPKLEAVIETSLWLGRTERGKEPPKVVKAWGRVTYTDPWLNADHTSQPAAVVDGCPVVPATFLASFVEFPDQPWTAISDGPMKQHWTQAFEEPTPTWFNFSRYFAPGRESYWADEGAKSAQLHAEAGLGVFLVAFDWNRFDDQALLDAFRGWLKANRPPEARTPKKRKSNQQHWSGFPLEFQPVVAVGWLQDFREAKRGKSMKAILAEKGVPLADERRFDSARVTTLNGIKKARRIIEWFKSGGHPPRLGWRNQR